MESVDNIKQNIKDNKSYLLKKYPIKNIALFGSYTKNQQNIDSDIDILVEFKGQIGIRFIDLADELEQLLSMKVDLVSRNGIKSKYYEAIKNDLVYV